MTGNLLEENRDFHDDEEINLLDYWRIIWKRKLLIILLVFVTVLTTAIASLFEIDIYEATAVITPTGGEKVSSGLSILTQQFGGIPGISLPPSASATGVTILLKSNTIKEKMIERYNLLPVLFYEQWDEEKKEWKRGIKGGISLNPFRLISSIAGAIKPEKGASNPGDIRIPTMWNGLRALNSIIKIKNNIKENSITISAEFHDPEMAAKMVNYLLETITNHMSSDAKRVANNKKMYLEELLRTTADPLIRQKIYGLISQQIETAMMSELKEDFAFKVIDPPRVPDTKIKPKRSVKVMLSFVTSLFAGVFLAFLLEYIIRTRNKVSGGMDV
jgi:uncharacterized protein involved in exopolysaccharide biosynthesis